MNPFEDPEASFVVLVNEVGQHSLWPEFLDVPAGWRIARQKASRADCLEFIERNWQDLRPQRPVGNPPVIPTA
ncbi:MbtH family protein [Kitasatospora sp. NPDC086791]|uniref:MbtH family protein n=1 Tax=Kitasatospora sp. NPDC086791 TaxID=3155178 RepID=UPI0034274B9B